VSRLLSFATVRYQSSGVVKTWMSGLRMA
jgi:hypothetical protein